MPKCYSCARLAQNQFKMASMMAARFSPRTSEKEFYTISIVFHLMFETTNQLDKIWSGRQGYANHQLFGYKIEDLTPVVISYEIY